ncbi:MAG: hypothetical protein GYA24_20435 [Candidatus Lokiarchaeota archaeon]|nr:hypothetical protein [Candidatus Lokiarchaeota archaeon]
MTDEDPAWSEFLRELARKTKSKGPGREGGEMSLPVALNNAMFRPDIYILHGIHGNILFPDVGYCEFDDPVKAWQHLQHWCDKALHAKGEPGSWQGGFPAGFEIGIVSLEELAKSEPVWPLLKECGADIINPLYSEPYLRHCSEESTIRQFEIGLDILARNGLGASVFASSEHALHPQLPQILKGFGIGLAFATARLAGGAPTSYLPKVEWEGLDGTVIPAIVQQSGLPNGHVWHGRFFEELPGMIFNAVARPDLPAVVYANIEDFANPMPGSDAIASHAGELERARIRLRGFSDMAKAPLPVSRRVRWSIEDFPIRYMESRLISLARRCEDFLVMVEAADVLLAALGTQTHEGQLVDAWKKLLAAQNHDAYVVPFTVPGLYSELQGLEDTNAWTSEETIEERCMREIEVATGIGQSVLADVTGMNAASRRAAMEKVPPGVSMLNVLWDRQEVIGGRLYDLPAVGYAATSSPFKSNASMTFQEQTIVIHGHKITIGDRKFPITRGKAGIVMDAGRYTATLRDAGNRIDIELMNQTPIEITIEVQGKVVTTYPFGAEPSTERFGHASRFAWIDEELLFAHDGTPYFKQEPGKFKLQVPAGEHAYCIARASTLLDAYKQAWEFACPPVPFMLPTGLPAGDTLARVTFNGCIPTSFRARNGTCIGRFLSIDGSEPVIEGGNPLDFSCKPARHEPGPWRILTYEIPVSMSR